MSISEHLIFIPEGAYKQQLLNEQFTTAILDFYKFYPTNDVLLIKYLTQSNNAHPDDVDEEFWSLKQYNYFAYSALLLVSNMENWIKHLQQYGIFANFDVEVNNNYRGTGVSVFFHNSFKWKEELLPVKNISICYDDEDDEELEDDEYDEYEDYIKSITNWKPHVKKFSTGNYIRRFNTIIPLWVSASKIDDRTLEQLKSIPTKTPKKSPKSKNLSQQEQEVKSLAEAKSLEESKSTSEPKLVSLFDLWQLRKEQLKEVPKTDKYGWHKPPIRRITSDFNRLKSNVACFEELQVLAQIMFDYFRPHTTFAEVVTFALVKYAQQLQKQSRKKVTEVSKLFGIDFKKIIDLKIELDEIYPTFICREDNSHIKHLEDYEFNKSPELVEKFTQASNELFWILFELDDEKHVEFILNYVSALWTSSDLFNVELAFAIPEEWNKADLMNAEDLSFKQEIDWSQVTYDQLWNLKLQPGMIINFNLYSGWAVANKEVLVGDLVELRRDLTATMPTDLKELNRYLWKK